MRKIIFYISILILISCKSTETVVIQPRIELNQNQVSQIEKSLIEFKRNMLYNETEKAFNDIDKVLDIDSIHPVALYERSKVFFQLKQFDDALIDIRAALASDPKELVYRKFEIVILQSKEDIGQVVDRYYTLITDYPDDEEIWFSAMDFFLLAKKYQESLDLLDRYEEIFGYRDAILINKFKLYIQLQKLGKLEKELKKYYSLYPNNITVLQLIGDFYLQTNQLDKGVDAYRKLLSSDSNNSDALLALADYYRANLDMARSFNYIERVIDLPNIEVDSKISILVKFMEIAKGDGQVDYYFKTLAVSLKQQYPDNGEVQLLYGNLLASEGNFIDAQMEIESALNSRPDNFQAWIKLIMIDNELKNNVKIIEHSSQALEYFPNQVELYYYRGFSHFLLEEYKAALKDFEFGNKITAKTDPLKFQFLYFIGECNYNLEQINLAFEYFDLALEINSNEISLLNNYAYYLSVHNIDLEKAKNMSLKTIKAEPKNETYLDTYAWVLFQNMEFAEALIYIEKAILHGGSSSSVLMEHYGDILFKLDRKDEAISIWKEAILLPDPTDQLKLKLERKKYVE